MDRYIHCDVVYHGEKFYTSYPSTTIRKKIWHILKMNIAINNHVIREWGNEAKMLHNMKKDRVRS